MAERTLILFLICWVFSAMAHGAANELPTVDSVIHQNELARSRIPAISFTYKRQFVESNSTGGSKFEDTISGIVLESPLGKFWITDKKVDAMDAGTLATLPERRLVTRMVLNDDYLAIWRGGPHDLIEQFDQASMANLSHDSHAQIDLVGEDVLEVAFGVNGASLRAIHNANPEWTTWAVEPVDGTRNADMNLVRLARYWSPKGARLWLMQSFDIDLNTGLIRHFQFFPRKNSLATQIEIDAATFDGNISVPRAFEITKYGALDLLKESDDPKAKQAIVYHEKTTLADIVLNVAVKAGDFRIAKFGAPNNTHVSHEYLNGRSSVEYIQNGIAVPRKEDIASIMVASFRQLEFISKRTVLFLLPAWSVVFL